MLSSWNIEKDARAYPTCKSFTFMHLRKNCVSIRKSVKKANNIQHQTRTSKQSLNSHLYTISSMILNIMVFSVMGYKYLCMCVNYTQNCMCIFHQYYLWFKFTRWARKASVRDEAKEIWWQKCEQKVLEEGYLLIQKDCSHKCLGPSFERRLTFDVVLEDCSVVILTWVDCQSCWGICFTTGVTSNDFNFASINIPALGNIKVPHTIIYQLVFASLKLKNGMNSF